MQALSLTWFAALSSVFALFFIHNSAQKVTGGFPFVLELGRFQRAPEVRIRRLFGQLHVALCRQFQQFLIIIGGRRNRRNPRYNTVPIFNRDFVPLKSFVC